MDTFRKNADVPQFNLDQNIEKSMQTSNEESYKVTIHRGGTLTKDKKEDMKLTQEAIQPSSKFDFC